MNSLAIVNSGNSISINNIYNYILSVKIYQDL